MQLLAVCVLYADPWLFLMTVLLRFIQVLCKDLQYLEIPTENSLLHHTEIRTGVIYYLSKLTITAKLVWSQISCIIMLVFINHLSFIFNTESPYSPSLSPHSSRAVLAVRVPYIMDQVFALIWKHNTYGR